LFKGIDVHQTLITEKEGVAMQISLCPHTTVRSALHLSSGQKYAAGLFSVLLFTMLCFSSRAFAQCGPMDVAFIVDDTGSMSGAINNVKAELSNILDSIETSSGNDYRLALVTFKDNVTVQENFSANNRVSITPKIMALAAGGGDNEPEASDEALNTVINALSASGRPQNMDFNPPFRATSLKIIILVTDARPGGFDDQFSTGVDDVNAHSRATEAAAKGIKISAIFVPTFGEPVALENIMKDYADTTSGVYIKTPATGLGTADAIKTIIASCGGGAISAAVSDQKPGSALFYNIYTSNSVNAQENTLISITNTNPTTSVYLHLFFVDGKTCAARDFSICLTRSQTATFKASDYDPDTTGYLFVMAANADGCPINFNYLVGSEYVRFPSGHFAKLGAEAVSSVAAGRELPDSTGTRALVIGDCNTAESKVELLFDGRMYDRLPRTIAADNIANLNDSETLMILNAPGGSLINGASSIGSVFGLLYDDQEKQVSFSYSNDRCQTITKISDTFPLTSPRFSRLVTRTGWMKFWSTTDKALLGAMVSRPLNPVGNSEGHNLHHLTYTNNPVVIEAPVFPLNCR
jgi:hypothetical protein